VPGHDHVDLGVQGPGDVADPGGDGPEGEPVLGAAFEVLALAGAAGRDLGRAAVEQPQQLVQALVELVVAGGADVEADLVEDADGRLVLEQPRLGRAAPRNPL
jgi:hypothetical protein